MPLTPLPEVRRMVSVARQYIAHEVHFSYIVEPARECKLWAKVYGVHPAIQALAAEWLLLADKVWNEYGQHYQPLSEGEFRRHVAADLGEGQDA